MSWLFGSSSGKAAAANPDTKSQASQGEKPKPCCVCKDEKAARDDCMLFSKSDDPAKECQTLIDQYKSCMLGYGFKV
ncbi:hypothetical protein N7539_009222 [Penicillium diatomitis]|uniref:Cytochrome c oxidase copper chaperone Cox17 n=1 Tax=Penicillium diatomitis TaxID=2819901 RepID=A0A9W9WLC0_9EURO|nr:uncharacterized protein N7539_009222 [Penicillium diatomitis]KAJ5469604.1 hypothetical protein N7539_009222 [Penicillium diatomitis]